MELMSLQDKVNYWEHKADEIARDNSLDSKTQFYGFIDAYETYLFYREALFEVQDDAREVAIARGLGKNM